MSSIKELSPHLRVLEITGLQFFSLSSLNLKSKKLKFASKNFKIYFSIYLILLNVNIFVHRDRYPYFTANDDKWKNSVRHNLSMNPHFRKGNKSKHGAGHLWVLADFDDMDQDDGLQVTKPLFKNESGTDLDNLNFD